VAWALACLLSAPVPLRAAEIVLPLTVRFELLLQQLTRELYTEPGGVAPLWREGRCRYLSLDHPGFERRGAFLRFFTHGDGVAGTRVLWFCLNALRWRGYVEALTAPYVTADWQLRLRVAESNLYDESWRKGLLSGLLWDVTERALLPRLTGLSVDLRPPRDDVLGLIRMVVAPSDAARMEAILRTATVRVVEVRDDAAVVHLVLDVPDSFVKPRPAPAQSEPPLDPAELQAVEKALERWDAFIVFVVKSLGLDVADPGVRAELFGLLIESRYEVLPILAGDVRRSEGDPVRRLFTEAWGHLHDIVARAEPCAMRASSAPVTPWWRWTGPPRGSGSRSPRTGCGAWRACSGPGRRRTRSSTASTSMPPCAPCSGFRPSPSSFRRRRRRRAPGPGAACLGVRWRTRRPRRVETIWWP
jgi:hypothetical protein